MRFACCEPRRLEVLKRSGSQNAIEFVEVLDRAAPPGAPRQRTLFVRLLRAGFSLDRQNVRIAGGERIRTVGVEWAASAEALPAQAEPGLTDSVDDLPRTLVVRTDSAGDFSTYTLSLVASATDDQPPAGFDPRLSSIAFSFKVECPSDFDCAQPPGCPPSPGAHPEIDYLAKDYQGFRRLMLDRLSLLVPGWTERSEADLGVTLVELLAYAADNLSYRQDAIANEAYLATARKRVSVRRHARLVDYFLHEGCNARALVCFELHENESYVLGAGRQLLTRTPDLEPVVGQASLEHAAAIAAGALVFETAHEVNLDHQLNRLRFYTWGDDGCCLARGSTQATLRDHIPALRKGDILIFEEEQTTSSVADLTKRWAVRLTDVWLAQDPSGGLFKESPSDGPIDITEIRWDAADALPFPLCLSVVDDTKLVEVGVARGNVVLADHGRSVSDESLGVVPKASLHLVGPASANRCAEPDKRTLPPAFRPALSQAPLTHGFDLHALLELTVGDNDAWWPASSLLAIDPHTATPHIALTQSAADEAWTVHRDLLESQGADTHFVVEVEDDGRARLRFGDGVNGKRPAPETSFQASYRVGNGALGNVGAEAIGHLVSADSTTVKAENEVFKRIRNPLPAAGGVDPEDMEVARRDAPEAFRTQERAVTAADYAAAAERRPDVQRAAATFRWTGSWYTVFATADRFGGAEVDARFASQLRGHLERFRLAGYDLAVRPPRYVPLDVALHLCVGSDHLRSNVVLAALRVLSSEVLPDGTRGLFHPDNFTFGDAVYLSRLVAAAQSVAGVESVRVDRFQRLVNPSPTTLDAGVIAIGAQEIAQLANHPSFPERGRIRLSAGGGL